ncbi:prepilin-type N-terminal cleavage/methylation domain-containing protein [Microbacterium sp. KR10-403]|uniref:PulJ/GspJ family protein n=1 Tax=Microbacterium sp. KR10-403 TaxID=3158581 RepID=UPI0032E50A50
MRQRNESGMTLLEMVVAMVIFGLVTLMIFQLVATASRTMEETTTGAEQSTSVALTLTRLAKEVRGATGVAFNEQGDRLYLRTNQNAITTWRLSENGLTNGARTFENITDAHFSSSGGEGVLITLAVDDFERSITSHPRALDRSVPFLEDPRLSSGLID